MLRKKLQVFYFSAHYFLKREDSHDVTSLSRLYQKKKKVTVYIIYSLRLVFYQLDVTEFICIGKGFCST